MHGNSQLRSVRDNGVSLGDPFLEFSRWAASHRPHSFHIAACCGPHRYQFIPRKQPISSCPHQRYLGPVLTDVSHPPPGAREESIAKRHSCSPSRPPTTRHLGHRRWPSGEFCLSTLDDFEGGKTQVRRPDKNSTTLWKVFGNSLSLRSFRSSQVS